MAKDDLKYDGKDPAFERAMPEEKRVSSGDHSGRGRPRKDDHVMPEGGGRSEFGTHHPSGPAPEKRSDPDESEQD